MAHLSDDDVPTMTGTSGSLVEDVEDSGDTTSADLNVPVAAAIHAAVEGAAARAGAPPDTEDDDTASHDAEDRTVQQKVGAPGLARSARPDVPSPPTTGPSTLMSASASPSSTGPAATGPPTQPGSPNTVASPTSSSPGVSSGPSTDPSGAPTSVDDDELEDSVTATAPRIPSSRFNITIPGAVEIRTVEHDELLDETEVKTMANLPPELQRAIKNARGGQDPHAPQRSQPPPPPRPAAGAPPAPSVPAMTKASHGSPVAAAAPTNRADAMVATELDPEELAPDSDEVLPADEEGITAQSIAPRIGSTPDTDASPPSGSKTPKDLPPTGPPSTVEPETSKTGGAAVAAAIAASVGVDEPATRPGLGGEASATDDPPTRPGLMEPPTRPGIGDPPTNPRVGNAPTSKRLEIRATAESERDDSVTTRAPSLSPELIAAVVAKANSGRAPIEDDSTDGTTTKVKRSNLSPAPPPPPVAGANESPADGESESITTQAPGPLTNILRVIAADRTSSSDAPIEDDEPVENHTAVMPNAPLITAAQQHLANGGRSNGLSMQTQLGLGPRAVAAPQLNPTSESGLRVARPGSGSGERMSVGAMAGADPRTSGVARSAMPGDGGVPQGLAIANTELAFPPGSTPQPSLHEVDLGKGPRYGLLVGIVAIVSLIVPVTLFIYLRGEGEPRPPGAPNEPALDFQKHDGPRPKLEKNKKPPAVESSSAAPSASASAKPPDKKGFPFRR